MLQGVSELFPVSSLGHTVVLPCPVRLEKPRRFREQARVVLARLRRRAPRRNRARSRRLLLEAIGRRSSAALVHSARTRSITTPTERLGWLLVVATIPAGITGILFEHELRVLFTKPLAASIFLVVNGFILFGGEAARRRAEARERQGHRAPRELRTLDFREAGVIGTAQVLALLAGISRSGITMVAGLVRGLDYEDAARFSFLLATPVILAAGFFKLPDLVGSLGNGVRGQAPRRRPVRVRRRSGLGPIPHPVLQDANACGPSACTASWPVPSLRLESLRLNEEPSAVV